MYISSKTAQEIVEEIGKQIDSHINLMDEQGIIIASTDHTRIGTLHDGALKIIKENLSELFITKEMQNETTRCGTNLPVVVDGEITGVVGITGSREQVYGYGNIVRSMTEILISDSLHKDRKRYDRRQKYHILEQWIYDADAIYSTDFKKKAVALGIDITQKYRVMILRFKEHEVLVDSFSGQHLLEEMEATIRHEAERQNILYLREATRQICILKYCTELHICQVAAKLSNLVEEKYKKHLLIGYDGSKGNDGNIKRAIYEAEKALTQTLYQEENVLGYDSLGMELFLHEISYNTMEDYLHKLFGKMDKNKMVEYMKLIQMYFQMNGSIQKMAEALYVHKNTVQYKLSRLSEITGEDIRMPAGAANLYMAWQFFCSIRY